MCVFPIIMEFPLHHMKCLQKILTLIGADNMASLPLGNDNDLDDSQFTHDTIYII